MYANNLPDHHFATKRLLIRLPMPGDGSALFQSLRRSRQELSPWISWATHISTLEQAESGVRQANIDFLHKKDLRFHLFELDSGAFIGSCGLHKIEWTVPRMEIGYWIDSRFQGKGYMTEAVQAVISYAFMTHKVHRLEIRCDPANKKSRAIPEKLGFELEATLKENERRLDQPGFADTCIYTLFQHDYFN